MDMIEDYLHLKIKDFNFIRIEINVNIRDK